MPFQLGKSRILAPLAIVAAAGLALAGCSTPSAEIESSFTTDPSKIEGDITFTSWWAYANQELVDGFAAEYPNVNVTLDFTAADNYPTKLQTLASSGDLPDVFAAQGPSIVELVGAHQLFDLTDALSSAAYDGEAASWGESFNSALLAGANAGLETPGGEIYGLPFNAISVASIYNQDIFEEVGVEVPTTFSELLSNCTVLKDAGYIPMSLTGSVWSSWWTALAWDQTMSGQAVADFSVDDPNFIKGLEIVEEMAQAGCWAESQIATDIAAETSLFLQKKTAQFVSVPENFLASVVDGADFAVGSYVIPALDGKEPNRIIGGGAANVLVVNAGSKNLSAAVAFAKYLTSTEVQTELASTQFTIPSLDIDLSSGNPLMAAYLEAAGNGFTAPAEYMPAWSTSGLTTYRAEVLPKLILGQITPAEAAKATEGLFQ